MTKNKYYIPTLDITEEIEMICPYCDRNVHLDINSVEDYLSQKKTTVKYICEYGHELDIEFKETGLKFSLKSLSELLHK